MNAPLGSAVIQTSRQYHYYQIHREEIEKKYKERIDRLKSNKPEVRNLYYIEIKKSGKKSLLLWNM